MSAKIVNKKKIYYDACALDRSKYVYADICNIDKNTENIISHLSLGEAYGNCFNKSEDARSEFTALIEKLIKSGFFRIVGNEKIENELSDVNEICGEMRDITDAIHLATALKKGCSVLKTADSDLYDLHKDKKKKLAEKYQFKEGFVIENVKNMKNKKKRK